MIHFIAAKYHVLMETINSIQKQTNYFIKVHVCTVSTISIDFVMTIYYHFTVLIFIPFFCATSCPSILPCKYCDMCVCLHSTRQFHMNTKQSNQSSPSSQTKELVVCSDKLLLQVFSCDAPDQCKIENFIRVNHQIKQSVILSVCKIKVLKKSRSKRNVL